MLDRLPKDIVTSKIIPYLRLPDIVSGIVNRKLKSYELYKYVEAVTIHSKHYIASLALRCNKIHTAIVDIDLDYDDYRLLSQFPIERLRFSKDYGPGSLIMFPKLKYLNVRNSTYSYDPTNMRDETLSNLNELHISLRNDFSELNDVIDEYKSYEKRTGKKLPIVGLTIDRFDYIPYVRTLTVTDLDIIGITCSNDQMCQIASLRLKKLTTSTMINSAFDNSSLEYLHIKNPGFYTFGSGPIVIGLAPHSFPYVRLPKLNTLLLNTVSIDLSILHSMPIEDLSIGNCLCDYKKLSVSALKHLTIIDFKHEFDMHCIKNANLTTLNLTLLSITDHMMIDLPRTLKRLRLEALTGVATCETLYTTLVASLQLHIAGITHRAIERICTFPLTNLDIQKSVLSSKSRECINKLGIRERNLSLPTM